MIQKFLAGITGFLHSWASRTVVSLSTLMWLTLFFIICIALLLSHQLWQWSEPSTSLMAPVLVSSRITSMVRSGLFLSVMTLLAGCGGKLICHWQSEEEQISQAVEKALEARKAETE